MKKKRDTQPLTTAQQLSSLIKSARDIMRKDKGLSGDLDRLPMLTWIMFLKFLDDLEQIREQEATIAEKKFRPAIEPPYRWRDWAAKEDGITGDELIAFINQEKAIRPDGTEGPGLFAYLRSLQSSNGADRRDVIGSVFRGIVNRMINGYLLRDVINKINSIHFTSSEEIHTLGHFYESMLKEMRDSAGDSGEFYTPRPVVRFMVEVINPRLGENVLDPACGTGGFLVEAFKHLGKQCRTVQDRKILQTKSISGGEAKPLPYLLAQMNLLLHGLEYPRIDPLNSLRFPLKEIGDRDRVEVILTNPPFGGEEERGILGNFPEDKQTAETALLFLQLLMRKLKRPKQNVLRGGRAAVVVPDGILSQEGIAARIREELVTKYNLHTIVRLPRGVFEPYTKINTNILFFDTNPSEGNVLYYEVKMRSDVKAYTQHRPLLFEELEPCISWWTDRSENEYTWKVSYEEIARNKFSLDFKNPNKTSGFRYTAPKFLIEEISSSLQTLLKKRDEFASLVEQLELNTSRQRCNFELFEKLTQQVRRPEQVLPDRKYRILAMAWYAKGLSIKYEKEGSEIKANILYRVEKGDFVYNRLFAWKGAFAVVKEDTHNCYVSNEFPCFKIVDDRLVPGFLWCYFAQPMIWDYIESLSSGTTSTSRLRLKENRLRQFQIPLPPKPFQEELANIWEDSIHLGATTTRLSNILGDIGRAIFERVIPFRF